MGIAFSVTSLAWLTGPPIAGAILSNSNHWSKAIIFSGVSYDHALFSVILIDNNNRQVLILASVPTLLISRHGHAKRKNTPYV